MTRDEELQEEVVKRALWWATVLSNTSYTPYAELNARAELSQVALELHEYRG